MHALKTIDFLWLVLMSLTLGTALLAESADPGFLVTIVIATVIGIKGRLVVERFMELHNANRYIRYLMNAYFYFFPVMIVLADLYPEVVARWTTL